MGLERFTNDEIKTMLADPKKFFNDKTNMGRLLGLDGDRRRLADVMKYEMGMAKGDIKSRLDKLAKVQGVSIDI
jgi:hypothetical protein